MQSGLKRQMFVAADSLGVSAALWGVLIAAAVLFIVNR